MERRGLGASWLTDSGRPGTSRAADCEWAEERSGGYVAGYPGWAGL